MDDDGHDFTHTQLSTPLAARTCGEQMLVPVGFKLLTEIIDMAEEFQ
jgi:hypothetical protein